MVIKIFNFQPNNRDSTNIVFFLTMVKKYNQS